METPPQPALSSEIYRMLGNQAPNKLREMLVLYVHGELDPDDQQTVDDVKESHPELETYITQLSEAILSKDYKREQELLRQLDRRKSHRPV